MPAEREKIASGTIFTDGVIRIMKDHVFGWVVLLRDSPEEDEEGYTLDEIPEDIFERVVVATDTNLEAFPEEFREYLREFDKRTHKWRTRRLH